MRRWFLSPGMSRVTLLAVLSLFNCVGIVALRAQSDVSVHIVADLQLPAAVPTYVTVLVSNAGPAAASGLRLTNDLPAGSEFLSSDGAASCSLVAGSIVCDLGTIGSQETAN